jgi:hypothetical protein
MEDGRWPCVCTGRSRIEKKKKKKKKKFLGVEERLFWS